MNKYRYYFNEHFKLNNKFLKYLDYSFEFDPKTYQEYKISKMLIMVQDFEYLMKEKNLLLDNYRLINSLEGFYKKALKIEEYAEEYLKEIKCPIKKAFVRDEIEEKFGLNLTKYIYNKYSGEKVEKQVLEDMLLIYAIPEVNSRNKYVKYYYDKCIKLGENRNEFLQKVNELDEEIFDIIQSNIDALLINLGNKKIQY